MDNQQVSNSTEQYKQHPTYSRLEISNLGNVRCFKTKKQRYTRVNKQGYLSFTYKINGKPKLLKVHRLVAEVFLPPPPDYLVEKCKSEHHGKVLVKHKDNNKLNNVVENLEWSDLKGNTQQAWADGLILPRKGQENGRAVLTEEIVHKMCEDFQTGMMPKEAVEKYGVSVQQATKIRAGFQWKHIWSLYEIKVNRRVKTSTISS